MSAMKIYTKIFIALLLMNSYVQSCGPSFFVQAEEENNLKVLALARSKTGDASALFPGQGIDGKKVAAVALVVAKKQVEVQNKEAQLRCIVN